MTRFAHSKVLLFAFLVGCGKPPVEAPKELNEVLVGLTGHFEDEDPAELIALATALEPFIVDGDVDARASTPLAITEADLGGLPVHGGFVPEEQIPVAVGATSAFSFDDQMDIVAETNHVCIESKSTKYFSREFETDLDCFVSGSCDTLLTSNEVRKESFVADIWYDLFKEYRRFNLEDGRDVMVARSWTEEVFFTDGGGGSWDQLVGLEAWIDDGSGQTKRHYTIWSSVQLTGVGADLYSALVRDGIDEGYAYADDFLSGFSEELCSEDRDRAYDR